MKNLPIKLQKINIEKWLKKNGHLDDYLDIDALFDNLDTTLSYSENLERIKNILGDDLNTRDYSFMQNEFYKDEPLIIEFKGYNFKIIEIIKIKTLKLINWAQFQSWAHQRIVIDTNTLNTTIKCVVVQI